MFHLRGEEFSKLVRREFTATAGEVRHAGKLDGLFECYTSNLRSKDFDILHFRSGFEDDICVKDFRDNTHVSLHFQLAGHSAAEISGVGKNLMMKKGVFNLFNCVDPVSNFNFPRQQTYEYLCLGLKPGFFDGLLEQCGKDFEDFLEKSQRAESFSLFPDSQAMSMHQWNALQSLQTAPVADAIRPAYLKAKVEELTLLSLGFFKSKPAVKIAAADRNKLMSVRDFLKEHFLDDLSLSQISREFLLNEYKLKSGFRQLFGMTVFGFIHEQRMIHARKLLENGETGVGEAAAAVGYQTDTAFIRAFKLFHGISPGRVNR